MRNLNHPTIPSFPGTRCPLWVHAGNSLLKVVKLKPTPTANSDVGSTPQPGSTWGFSHRKLLGCATLSKATASRSLLIYEQGRESNRDSED